MEILGTLRANFRKSLKFLVVEVLPATRLESKIFMWRKKRLLLLTYMPLKPQHAGCFLTTSYTTVDVLLLYRFRGKVFERRKRGTVHPDDEQAKARGRASICEVITKRAKMSLCRSST